MFGHVGRRKAEQMFSESNLGESNRAQTAIMKQQACSSEFNNNIKPRKHHADIRYFSTTPVRSPQPSGGQGRQPAEARAGAATRFGVAPVMSAGCGGCIPAEPQKCWKRCGGRGLRTTPCAKAAKEYGETVLEFECCMPCATAADAHEMGLVAWWPICAEH